MLLIVPEGIEMENDCRTCFLQQLLIVPEGIEILSVMSTPSLRDTLLIVPEGIEISYTFRAEDASTYF